MKTDGFSDLAGLPDADRAILKRDQRTIRNGRASREAHITADAFSVDFCGGCSKGRHAQSAKDSFTLSRFPVMFFRISNLGMCALAGTPCGTCDSSAFRTFSFHVDILLKRLVEVFIIGVCLLTIVRAPTAMSAPISCKEGDGADGSSPLWKKPCGEILPMDNLSEGMNSGESDQNFNESLITVTIALDQMYNYIYSYVEETFGAPYESIHKMFNHSSRDWLPNRETEVPKTLGEEVNQNHLSTLEINKFLKNIYVSMQKYAVGIEQVVWDQKELNGRFQNKINDTESNLRKVLCELRTIMYYRAIEPPTEVNRCIMNEETRKITSTAGRNLRDWIILRETLNGLEYLFQALQFFNMKYSSQS